MSVGDLLTEVRATADPRAWASGVKLARDGAVVGVSEDGEEVRLHVRAPSRPTP